MIDVLKERKKKGNKVLFRPNDEIFSPLNLLLEKASHREVILWALDLAEEDVKVLSQKYPCDNRAKNAFNAAEIWSRGQIKMREAQRAILDCHAAAKEISSASDIALYHAVGQACSTVHTAGHAMGFPVYDLTAAVVENFENCLEIAIQKTQRYIEKLHYVLNNPQLQNREWACFLNG